MATCGLKFIANKTLTKQSITDYRSKNPDPTTEEEKEKRKCRFSIFGLVI